MRKFFNSIRIFIVSSFLIQGGAAGFITAERAQQAEIITALARGPLAMLSHQYHNDYSGKAKLIHVATDLTRIANTMLSMVNHQDDLGYVSYVWAFFDIFNVARDLKTKRIVQEDSDLDLDTNANMIALTEQDTEKDLALDKELSSLNQIIEASQKFLLPFIESTTALLVATNAEQTPQARFDRRRMRAASSLARALSELSKNKKSVVAIAMLLGAVTEMIIVTLEIRDIEQSHDNTYRNAHDPEALENLANDLRQQNRPAINDPHIRAIQRRINQLRHPQENRNNPVVQGDNNNIINPHDQAQQLENFVNLLIQHNRYQENSPFIQDLRNRIRQLRR